MAEEAEAAAQTAQPPKKKKLFLLIGAGAVIALLGGGGWYYYKQHSTAETTRKAAAAAEEAPFLVEIPTVLSNLDSSSGHPVFVKISAKLEVVNTTPQKIAEMMPVIQNVFQTYLHETSQTDLSGNGIYRLREALLNRIAVQLAPIEVKDLLFTEFLIQ